MKKLSELIENVTLDIDILGITNDSRCVKEGYLFIATKGYNEDHFLYVDEAIKNKAAFIVADREIPSFPHLVVNNINEFYIECCRKFYDITLSDFNFIGITGTDGKTTTTSIIKELLNYAYIGTNGLIINDEEYKTSNTTPIAEELYKSLNIIKKKGFNNVVMEVSSESLLHNRLAGISFDTIGFTNITEDHLNVHKTLENYRNCKFSLVNYLKKDGLCFINGDCNNCRMLKYKNIITYGMNEDNNCIISDIKETSKYLKFKITYQKKTYLIESPLKGTYNAYNITLAFLICLEKNIDSKELLAKIKNLKPIKGRREFLDLGQKYPLILDYAHTLNGIENIVKSCQNYQKIIVVTGSAGQREKEKRPLIGKFLLDNTYMTIFTMDDPRYEDVNDIIDDMLRKTKKNNYLRIIDRKEAIKKALSLADKNTIVLILGKGRDNYMAIEDKKIAYSDYDTIKEILEKTKS